MESTSVGGFPGRAGGRSHRGDVGVDPVEVRGIEDEHGDAAASGAEPRLLRCPSSPRPGRGSGPSPLRVELEVAHLGDLGDLGRVVVESSDSDHPVADAQREQGLGVRRAPWTRSASASAVMVTLFLSSSVTVTGKVPSAGCVAATRWCSAATVVAASGRGGVGGGRRGGSSRSPSSARRAARPGEPARARRTSGSESLPGLLAAWRRVSVHADSFRLEPMVTTRKMVESRLATPRPDHAWSTESAPCAIRAEWLSTAESDCSSSAAGI